MEFKEPINALIELDNTICFVKENSIELLTSDMTESIHIRHFEDTILKAVLFVDVILVCFDDELVQLKADDLSEMFIVESDDEIRDLVIFDNVIYLCFQHGIGSLENNGNLVMGSTDDHWNLSTITCTTEYLVAADFDSKLVFFNLDFTSFKTIDYSSFLESTTENPPFPLLIKHYDEMLFIGTLNGFVILITPKRIAYEPSRKIKHFRSNLWHIYSIKYHNYVISDIILHENSLFISSNDRSISECHFYPKLEFKRKFSMSMRVESMLIQKDQLLTCGVDSPFIKQLKLN